MKRTSIALAATTASLLAMQAAHAGTDGSPRGTYVIVPSKHERTVHHYPPPRHRTLFFERHGASVTRGADDSAHNTSSIPSKPSVVTPWSLTDVDWQTFMACIRLQYSPFDIEITDVRPPNTVEYVMGIVGGIDSQVQQSGAGGVAPVTDDGSVIEQAIVYIFSDEYGSDVQRICEVAAQESAHAYGLDHELLCEDPMTYLDGCGSKFFKDQTVTCGEYSARDCFNGDPTQNSVQRLLGVLGAPDKVPPQVSVSDPPAGATVHPGFKVTADATDDVAVLKVDLFIDGVNMGSRATAPYEFIAPVTLPLGPHMIEVHAFDKGANEARASSTVTLVPDCTKDTECTGDDVCLNNRCTGGVGSTCTAEADCSTSICSLDPTDPNGTKKICTQFCSVTDSTSCPATFDCVAPAIGQPKCFAAQVQSGGGGCAVSTTPATRDHTGAGLGLAFFGLGLGLVLVSRKRR